ncbi:dihydrodipicolinate synthase family protein [Myxococcus xanthus DK 1622]|uniref:Dihydrodipicolinate synthase family protein n=1 Tax=Myxococcus xanthus (strain DK1622) TaxID=246197 RepID=Q1CXM5_MYXXD|nr:MULTISPECIES: dihydrodipicolinate synthase family protein [Myxococcus]ABF89325.1 dihydrodipicolinate synthase family protein [Myxococcus xanthus DK 1622]NOJ51403.1 dihydrodipicolinate synthase family protein [Myxococcus xanthus]QPM79038.1 dihydrodipicolinate synthase family protein [Myxococcus xanthus]QVW68116.1 dihydrodipicolinate synthase family protein [Myxococcus xanthus DZ2]QZZ54344.1 4-hydroxy-tetrahydrodipicolinate synthase [Myxococcus xanthus]
MSALLRGIVAYPITPFTSTGRVDEVLLGKIVDDMVKAGVHAIAPLGSTGVLPYLSDDEREQVAEIVIKRVAGRVPTLVGVSSLTTERTVHHAKHAEKLGASAVMIIPMSYWKLSDAEIITHYETVAKRIAIPIAVYNNPATGGLDLSPDVISRLLKIPNVTMVKGSTGDVNRMHRLVQLCGEDVAFYNGSNPLALAAFVAGARGWCTAAPHIIPKLNIELYDAIQRGDVAAARQSFYRQLPFLQFIVAHGLPRAISAALELQGTSVGPLRAPLQALPAERVEELRRILVGLEVIPGE